MYMEVAFNPSCMDSMEYYGLIRQHFGFEKGRYISADVRVWAAEAMRSVKESELQPVKKKSIKNFLNKLVRSKKHEEFCLAEDRKALKFDEWAQWWEEQKKVREFSITISGSASDGCINVGQINDGCEEWSMPPSVSVRRNSNDIVNTMLPLIQISKEIVIVDQYFRLVNNPVLVEIFNQLNNYSVEKLRVVTSMRTANASGVYDRDYRALNIKPVSFEWITAPERFFHDRYFITDVGAIRSGQGFMEDVQKGIHADFANLNIVSRDEADRTLCDLDGLLEDGSATIELS